MVKIRTKGLKLQIPYEISQFKMVKKTYVFCPFFQVGPVLNLQTSCQTLICGAQGEN